MGQVRVQQDTGRPETGTCELEPLSATEIQAHQRENELLFFYRGHGEAVIDHETYRVHPEMVIWVPRGVEHEVRNTTVDEALCFVWVHALPDRDNAEEDPYPCEVVTNGQPGMEGGCTCRTGS